MNTASPRTLTEHEGPFVSVHLDDSHDTEDAAKRLRLRLKEIEAELGEQGADRATTEAVLRAIQESPPPVGTAGGYRRWVPPVGTAGGYRRTRCDRGARPGPARPRAGRASPCPLVSVYVVGVILNLVVPGSAFEIALEFSAVGIIGRWSMIMIARLAMRRKATNRPSQEAPARNFRAGAFPRDLA